ncbi:hypothetical protein CgunFtcFv8_021555 [Champsocephalus gunnari]|uniref:Uncharacterized protein n=1 Tax=Champsocephalus gunnari TaxID=52237 RepID=A0AAN8HRR6_CHAGU|nr:hypothetical protein CgunFtcFv8_021555 [Champsocephalus gunnari]
MKNLKKKTAAIFLGFNMTELRKTKHNLLIPKQQPAETTEQPHAETAKRPPTDSTEQMENSEDGPEPMVESGKEKVTDVAVLPEVEPMEMENTANADFP